MNSFVPAFLLAASVTLTSAQAAPPDAGARPPPCQSPEHRQFDFWVGDWEVLSPSGKRLGTNRIELILEGCVLQENWVGGGGVVGKSFNIYDAAKKQWHQTWVDSSGSHLLLDGSFANGKMVLLSAPASSGKVERITWEAKGPKQVRQLWESSKDGGKSWSTSFDGLYVKK